MLRFIKETLPRYLLRFKYIYMKNNIGNRDDLKSCDGMQFNCKIKGTPTHGVISVAMSPGRSINYVYLCQNTNSGSISDRPNRHGFQYQWCCLDGDLNALSSQSVAVTEFKLLADG